MHSARAKAGICKHYPTHVRDVLLKENQFYEENSWRVCICVCMSTYVSVSM